MKLEEIRPRFLYNLSMWMILACITVLQAIMYQLLLQKLHLYAFKVYQNPVTGKLSLVILVRVRVRVHVHVSRRPITLFSFMYTF